MGVSRGEGAVRGEETVLGDVVGSWVCAGAIFCCGGVELGLGVGVGDCDLVRLYFIWPKANGATNKPATVAIRTRVIIKRRCSE